MYLIQEFIKVLLVLKPMLLLAYQTEFLGGGGWELNLDPSHWTTTYHPHLKTFWNKVLPSCPGQVWTWNPSASTPKHAGITDEYHLSPTEGTFQEDLFGDLLRLFLRTSGTQLWLYIWITWEPKKMSCVGLILKLLY